MKPRVPEDFGDAYAALVGLTERVARGVVEPENLGEEVDLWRADSCRGAGTLARAAINFLRYELAKSGLEKGDVEAAAGLEALNRIHGVLDTGSSPGKAEENGPSKQIIEVALPKAFREARPGARGFRMGELQIIFELQTLKNGVRNGHLSVSHPTRYPTIDELFEARYAPGGSVRNLWLHIPKPEQQNVAAPYTLHMDVVPPAEKIG